MTFLIRKLFKHINAGMLSMRSVLSGPPQTAPLPTPAPAIVPAQEHQIDPARISRHAFQVTETLARAGYRAFIVGGAVRDLLLGMIPKDFDVATDATPAQVQKLFRRARLIGRRFQIVHVLFGTDIIEVTTFRGYSNGAARLDDRARRVWKKWRAAVPHAHAIDASGRVLRDNVWGDQHEDAARRDFTVNALYYDVTTQTVLDYHNGMADLRARRLRMIGDPTTRYREDPVRMLRVVRFAAKLEFDIDEQTRAPIRTMTALLNNVPSARLFDEVVKLLLCGHAFEGVQRLCSKGLHRCVLPSLDAVLEGSPMECFIAQALRNTDARVHADKPVSPAFVFAVLLWHDVRNHWQRLQAAGEYPIPALYRAMDETLQTQTQQLAIQRRTSSDMKEIWGLQPRLEKRGRSALKLIEQARFRAAYDFLLLRCESGELEVALGDWWTAFIAGDSAQREGLLAQCAPLQSTRKRSRQRRKKSTALNVANSAPPEGADEQI